MGEMAATRWTCSNNYYIFDAFKRERLFYGSVRQPMGYYARIMDRYLRVIGDVGMYYALYDNFLFRYSGTSRGRTARWAAARWSSRARNAFSALKDTCRSPAPGSYKFDSDRSGRVRQHELQAGRAGLGASASRSVSGASRTPSSASDLGYYYYQHPLWFGSFWEKTRRARDAHRLDRVLRRHLRRRADRHRRRHLARLQHRVRGRPQQLPRRHRRRTSSTSTPAGTSRASYAPPSSSAPASPNVGVTVEPGLNNFTLQALRGALRSRVYAGRLRPAVRRLASRSSSRARRPGTSTRPPRASSPTGSPTPSAARSTSRMTTTTRRSATRASRRARSSSTEPPTSPAEWAAATGPEKQKLEQRLHEVRELLDVLRGLNHIYGASTLGF
jgi:hypothetical protein